MNFIKNTVFFQFLIDPTLALRYERIDKKCRLSPADRHFFFSYTSPTERAPRAPSAGARPSAKDGAVSEIGGELQQEVGGKGEARNRLLRRRGDGKVRP